MQIAGGRRQMQLAGAGGRRQVQVQISPADIDA